MEIGKELEVFESVFEKTGEGSLKWEATYNPQKFVTSVGGTYSFALIWPEDYDSPWLEMRDTEDRVLVTIKKFDDRLDPPEAKKNKPFSENLIALFELARRQALKVDESLGQALNSLKKL